MTRRRFLIEGVAFASMALIPLSRASTMNLSSVDEYLHTAEHHMAELGIKLRDTFAWNRNLDDWYANGNQFGGPRHVQIKVLDELEKSQVHGKTYEIPNFACVAYDSYQLQIPKRLLDLGRDDPVVHEAVHFLQWNTRADEKAYRAYDPTGGRGRFAYLDYIAQRVEIEAHVVQVRYIFVEKPDYRDAKINPALRAQIETLLEEIRKTKNLSRGIEIVGLCKNAGLI